MPSRSQDNEELKLLGRALAWLRDRAGMTQFEAGDRIGISVQGWSKYERGEAPTLFKPDTQRRLAEAIGSSREDLLLARDRLDQGLPAPAPHPPGIAEADSPPYMVGVSTRVRVDDTHMLAFDLRRSDLRLDLSWLFTPDAGFLRMAGSHLGDLALNGEILIFDRRQWPSRGQVCVVELTNGSSYVYEFLAKEGASLHCQQRQPKAAVEIPMNAVRGDYGVRMRGD